MKATTTNSNGETTVNEVPELPEDVSTSGYIDTEPILNDIKAKIDESAIPKMNRAQRRFIAKKAGKRGREQMETISEAAKKLTYINLIEGLRKLNKEKEKENENEATN